jgi:hypothetical protein
MIDDKHFEYGRKFCKCGNDTFNVVFTGFPVTPSPIAFILLKCDKCGEKSKVETFINKQ